MPSAKRQHSTRRAVRTPEALLELNSWLATLDGPARSRGKAYYEEGRVLGAWAEADHYVEAEVEGADIYGVTLFLTRGKWTSSCTCPMEFNCKHVVAAGLAWIANEGNDFDGEEDGFPPQLPPVAAKHQPGAKKKLSFREEWTPVLAEKLGRPLTDAEGRLLEQLSALFAAFVQSHHNLYEPAVRYYGFADALPPRANPWEPIFRGWWTYETAPADPWALWQYLAYSLEQLGRPIPEGFRPLTDTAQVHAALDALLTQQQLDAWRNALALPASVGGAGPAPSRLLDRISALRARIGPEGGLFIEARAAPNKPWKPPAQAWGRALAEARAAEFELLPPAEAALALALALSFKNGYVGGFKLPVAPDVAAAIFAHRAAHGAIVLPDGRPFAVEPEPLAPEAVVSAMAPGRLDVRLVRPDGTSASGARLLAGKPVPLYLQDGRVWRGPPPLPGIPLPTAALADANIMTHLRNAGVRLPASLELKRRVVLLRPLLRLSLIESRDAWAPEVFQAELLARSDDPACEQRWRGIGAWQWTEGGAPPPRRPDDPIHEFDLAAAQAVAARFADFRLGWNDWNKAWVRPVTKAFPEDFLAWHATLPLGIAIEVTPNLAGLIGAPLRAHVDFTAIPEGSSHDWFDLTVALRVEDTTLAPDEIALLLKARGKWVRLPDHGWRRIEFAVGAGEEAAAVLDRLGLGAEDVLATGRPATHRLHALQLVGEAVTLESRDARLAAALRERAARIAAVPAPALPGGLMATLRPYQIEGFHFLAHLAAQGFGGVLADDMGLGKTVQTLAWLLHLASLGGGSVGATPAPFRALVICPKSVMHGWLAETERFAPTLRALPFAPALAEAELGAIEAGILVVNYTQLRLHAGWLQSAAWDAVVLDEGQFIKNPSSQVAAAARALRARHRLVLTGTPIENRLSDLWSLFAFAQPGLLGTQPAFKRQYPESDPAALARLRRRTHHFLLRRTKAQAAPDLPPRTEDDLVIELEPAQRKLYDAELKRARAQLLRIQTDRALDKMRFSILASLLRLRQICCHPALVDPAHRELPSAKLDALLERLEELRDEGHQVLVFSQFVEMLEIIRTRLAAAGIGHLMLTGATENRAALVEEFQRNSANTVFLLSLKAAGFGLNLTAASYAVLYDPWWNPAVEAQAIDRTHRIGQMKPVIAYRLLAAETVEQKIRALQKEKAALAAAVVQEESLASVLDLESLRRILA